MTREKIPFASLSNGGVLPLEALPSLAPDEFAEAVVESIGLGLRISAYFGSPVRDKEPERIIVLADDERNRLYTGRSPTGPDGFPSIATACPQAQLFEREIAEQFGLVPRGHPWLKPVRYCRSWTIGSAGRDAWGRAADEAILPGVGDFYRVEGEGIHEVAVGPVHAGVIEPGHFRFQCHGERVIHLEIALGYQHRGIEEALIGGPNPRSLHYAETIAGDSTIAHASSYCQVLEALSGYRRPARAQALQAIALELERLANHLGDMGAL